MSTRRSARLSASVRGKAEAGAGTSPTAPATVAAASDARKRKVFPPEKVDGKKDAAPPEPSPPTTPRKRRRVAKVVEALPPTPTPDAVGLMSNSLRAPVTPRHKALSRVADPRATNAPLLSPETSHVVASRPVNMISPSKAMSATTTATLLSEANAHLIKVDPRMKPLVDANHCHMFSPEGLAEQIDPFEALASGIISQQVSGAAARSIKAKFVALFDATNGDTQGSASDSAQAPATKKRFPHPSRVAATSLERLRTAGLSQRKAEYIQGLAQKFASSELTTQMLADAPYEEVLEKLTAVRGLGRWSVEMFACFALKRMDVFSLGDLGVQRGMAAFVGRDVAKLKNSKAGKWKYMSEADMTEISDRFTPYRSLFMWYMWRVEETDVSTMG